MSFGEHMTDEGLSVEPMVAGYEAELKALGTRINQAIELRPEMQAA